MSPRIRPVLATLVVIGIAAIAEAVDVTRCGQKVPSGTIGVLARDLRCSSVDGAIVLGRDARLDLAGHAITIDPPLNEPSSAYAATRGAVECARCRIRGPGRIVGAQVGVLATERAIVKNLRFEQCGRAVLAFSDDEYSCGGVVRVAHVTAVGGAGVAISGEWVFVSETDIRDHGAGIGGRQVRVDRVSVVGGRGTGVSGWDVFGTRLRVRDNDGVGVHAERLWLTDSTLVGNGRAGEAPWGDVFVSDALRFNGVICDTSTREPDDFRQVPTESWRACRQDDEPRLPEKAGPPRWRRDLKPVPQYCGPT